MRLTLVSVIFVGLSLAPARPLTAGKPPGPATAPATAPAEASFLRFVEKPGGGELQSAVVSYRNKTGVVVHLIGAIHIGERGYYEGLNKLFEGYDALLYELVTRKDVPPPPREERGGGGFLGALQNGLGSLLSVEHQLDVIDYHRPNFVHADLDVDAFEKAQKAQNESFLGFGLRTSLADMSRRSREGRMNDMSGFAMLNAMMSPDRDQKLRYLLGKQIAESEASLAEAEDKNASVLIGQRNQAAIDVLKKVMGQGKKDIGIFYGAGHMKDMSRRLAEMGFVPADAQWRTVWTSRFALGPATMPATRK